MNIKLLTNKAKQIRRDCVTMSANAGASHVGCALSMVDMITYLYFKKMNLDRDVFILSKGHAVLGLYATLYEKGLISKEDYISFHKNGTLLLEHPNHLVGGIKVSTGALGHGPAIATGLAWSMKIRSLPGNIYCLLGDGECQEGTVWETLIFISRLELSNLTLIIDFNNLQGYSDKSDTIFAYKKLLDMLSATGLNTYEIDGHNFDEIDNAFKSKCKKAKVVLAKTIKGKGVSFMEGQFEWHYKNPSREQLDIALRELR